MSYVSGCRLMGLGCLFTTGLFTTGLFATGLFATGAAVGFAEEIEVVVTFQNLSSDDLTINSPWIGFHDGTLDIYDRDSDLSEGLSWLATTGRAEVLAAEFAADGGGASSTILTLKERALASGERSRHTFVLDTEAEVSRFLTFAASLSTQEGTFLAAENPVAYPLFDDAGIFVGTSFLITDRQIFSLDDSGEYPSAKPAQVGARAEHSGRDLVFFDHDARGKIGILELARVTVRRSFEDEHEAAAGVPGADIETTPSPEETRIDVASREDAGAGDEGDGGEGSGDTGDTEESTGEAVEDLDLDRWERYSESLEEEDEEPQEDEDGRSEG